MSNALPLIDNISIYEGDDTTLKFTCLSDITGYKVELIAELGKDSPYNILYVTGHVPDSATSSYTIPINRADTVGKGRTKPYPYSIKLTAPSGEVHTDRHGELTIIPNVGGDDDSSNGSGSVHGLIDPNGLTDNAILKWDAAKNMLVASGVTSDDTGDLTTATNSVNIGVHEVGSAGRNIAVTNIVDGRTFNPLFQEVGIADEHTSSAYMREHSSMMELEVGTVTPPDNYNTVTNPTWSFTTANNETVFGIKLYPVHDMDDVIYTIKENTIPIYTASLGNFRSANPPSFKYFKTPFSLYANANYTVTLTCKDGSECSFYGTALGQPHSIIKLRRFELKELSTKDYVDQHGGGTGSGDMLKSVYDKNGNNIVDEAETVTGASTAGNSKYFGTDNTGNVGFHDLPDDEVTADQFDALKKEVEGHVVTLNNHGNEIQQHESQIKTNKDNIVLALEHSKAALTEANEVSARHVDGITSSINHNAKTVTFTLTSKIGEVDHTTVDLSSWFVNNPAPQDFDIWYGWSQNPPMDESEIQRLGTKQTVRSLNDLEITLTRSDSISKHMWVWAPVAHPINGFTFSGFTSVWQSSEVSIKGINGKFYYSPNPTSATNVNFEVKV